MPKTKVYRYKRYDAEIDDYRVSTRMATKEHIDRIGAEIIPGTEEPIDSSLITDGWTAKNFDAQQKPDRPHDSGFQTQVYAQPRRGSADSN